MRKFNKSVNQIISGGSGGGSAGLGDLVSATIYADIDALESAFPAASNLGKIALIGSGATSTTSVYADADMGWFSDASVVILTWPNPTDGEFVGQWGIEGGQLAYRWHEVRDGVFTWVPQPALALGNPSARIGPILGTEDSAADWISAGADVATSSASGNGTAVFSEGDGFAKIRAVKGSTGATASQVTCQNSDALTSATLHWASAYVEIEEFSGPNSTALVVFASQSDGGNLAWRLGRQQNVAFLEAVSQTTGEEALTTDGAWSTGTRAHIVSVVDSVRARAWLNGRLVLSAARANFVATSIFPRMGPAASTGTSSGNTCEMWFGAGSVWGVITA